MKKNISVIALSLATVFAASAQMNVVKEAERAMKAGKPAAEVVNMMKPAQTNSETSGLAQTWYFPGKASFNEYDKLLGLKQFNQIKPEDNLRMGDLLIQGYEYYIKALPLDTVTDAKGKVKTKYSKDIISTLVGHFTDYSQAGVDKYQTAQDYDAAYKLWAMFCAIPEIPAVREQLIKNKQLPNDTIIGEISFNQALAAWQSKKLPESLKAFDNARAHGYNKKQLYDFSIAVASEMNDSLAILNYSKEALPLYGKEDPMYISQIVNYYLQKKEYSDAFTYINQAIQEEPANSQYYVIRGILNEYSDKRPDAVADYQKAMQLDDKNSQAFFNYGRMLYEDAFKLNDQAPTTQEAYDKFFTDKIKPLFVQAVDIFEKAYNLDPENMDSLRYLKDLYYNLRDEAKLNDVENRMKAL